MKSTDLLSHLELETERDAANVSDCTVVVGDARARLCVL